MAMTWGRAIQMARVVWMFVCGWVSSCITVADEIARSIRTGDMGPFHIG